MTATFRFPATVFALALLLAGCGGSSTPPTAPSQPPGQTPGQSPGQGPGQNPGQPAAPTILEFTADRATYGIGDRATLTVRFSGGTGRIEGLGPVTSGTPVQTGPLDGPRELRLVVESTVAPAVARTLRLAVDYRDRYRPVGGDFRSVGHTATLADDGRVVLIGGSRGQSTLSSSVDVYDPGTGGFRTIGALRDGREGHRATRLTDGRILVTGGMTSSGRLSAELVDERTGRADPTGTPRVARFNHSATYLGNGRVLVAGGTSAGENAPLGISNTAEIWDARTGQFRLLDARLTVRRTAHSATLLPDGRVLLLGGFGVPGARYALAEVFDPATETFSPYATVDERERGLHATALLPTGEVLALGGETSRTEALNWVTLADGRTSASLARLLQPRTLVEAAVARDGRVYLFGGEVGVTPAATATAESYSVANGPAAIASMPGPRVGHTVTRLLDGRMLIAGGENRATGLVPTALVYE